LVSTGNYGKSIGPIITEQNVVVESDQEMCEEFCKFYGSVGLDQREARAYSRGDPGV